MTQIALSDDLNVITAEINSFKQVAGQSLFEIGKRLKHVKENDLTHGQFGTWVESIGFNPDHAHKYIQAVEQFSPTSANLGFSKLIEMISLPESVNRDDFITTEHIVPSTGEKKTVDEMTVRELREVKKELQEAERRASEAEQEKHHYLNLWNQSKNQPPKVVKETVTVNVMPSDYEDLKQQAINAQHLNNENVKLMRANQDIREMYEQKLTQQNKRESAKRDLQKYLAEQIRSVTMNHDSAILMYQGIQGDKEAYEIVTRYLTQYESIIKKQFHEWEQLTTLRAIN